MRHERQMDLFLRHLPGVLWTTDADLVVTQAVGRSFADLGIDPDALVGVAVSALPGTSPQMLPAHVAALRAGESQDYQAVLGDRTFDVRVEPVRDADGTIVGAIGRGTDVTELNALKRTFEQLALHGPDIVVRYDRDLRHLYISPAVEASTGIPPERFVGRTNRELGMPEHLCELWDRELGAVFATGEPRTFSFEFPGVSGPLWFEAHAAPEARRDGRVETVISFTRDRTEARAAEEAALAAERRYRELFELASELILLLGPDARIVDVNPTLLDALGYTRDEIVGQPVEVVLPPEEIALVKDRIERKLDGTLLETRYETRLLGKDGRRVPVEVSSQAVLRDGVPAGILAIGRDVSERLAADAALEESERRFRGAFDGAGIGMMLTDPTGTFIRVNAAFAEMLGYTTEELRGRRVQDVSHPEDIAEMEDDIRAMLAGTRHRRLIEKRYLHRDGSAVWGHVTVSPIRSDDGTTLYFVAQVEDVSELHRLEEQLRQAQKMEAVGRLAGGVAHDFNNLLLAIRGHAELALARAHGAAPSIEDDLTQIVLASERGAGLTRQLLAFSARQVMNPEVLDLGQVVADMVRLLRRLIGEDVELVTRRPDEPVHVLADAAQIEQVVANLAVNARDAMPGGGRLGVEVTAAGGRALLVVADNGSGMDEETRAHVFEPFFTTKEDGTGLGLATVHGIVTQSGGEVAVESSPGAGTTFTISLPLVDGPAQGDRAQEEPAAATGSGTVLVVEDDDIVRDVVARMLEHLGYSVLTAASGNAAIELAGVTDERIDLVVTDLVMNDLDGREAAEAIVAQRPETKVLFMSGHTEDRVIRGGHFEPGVAFIQKPFGPDALAQRVRDLLES